MAQLLEDYVNDEVETLEEIDTWDEEAYLMTADISDASALCY